MSVEPVSPFVDTNVLVYAHDISAGFKHDRAKALVEELWKSGKGHLSLQVLQEFYVTVTRKVPKPLEEDTATMLVSDLAQWRVHIPEVRDVLEAIRIHRRYGISFWDAMIIQSAIQLGCDVIWSEDLNPDQVYDSVRVINPFAIS